MLTSAGATDLRPSPRLGSWLPPLRACPCLPLRNGVAKTFRPMRWHHVLEFLWILASLTSIAFLQSRSVHSSTTWKRNLKHSWLRWTDISQQAEGPPTGFTGNSAWTLGPATGFLAAQEQRPGFDLVKAEIRKYRAQLKAQGYKKPPGSEKLKRKKAKLQAATAALQGLLRQAAGWQQGTSFVNGGQMPVQQAEATASQARTSTN